MAAVSEFQLKVTEPFDSDPVILLGATILAAAVVVSSIAAVANTQTMASRLFCSKFFSTRFIGFIKVSCL